MYTLIVVILLRSTLDTAAATTVNVPNISYQECALQSQQISEDVRRGSDKVISAKCILQAEPKQ
jgi:hypothetical protein